MNVFLTRIVAVLALAGAFSGSTAAQGLLFHGNEVDIAERSGLVLPDPDDKAGVADKLDVRFSLRVNNVNSSGFIFGVKDRESGGMLNLMMRRGFGEDSVYFTFNREGERELCSVAFAERDLLLRQLEIDIMLDKGSDKATVDIDGRDTEVTGLGLPNGEFRPQVNFGLTRHIVETASVVVSDLVIERDGVLTEIPLNESAGERVHDRQGRIAGRAFNPQWQINEAYYWRKLAEFRSTTPTGCAFDPLTRRFYSYSPDSLEVYDDLTRSVARSALTEIAGNGKGAPGEGVTPLGTSGERGKLPVLHGMNVFDEKNGRIYPYEIYYNDFTGEIDPATGRWRRLMATDDGKAMHHHAGVSCRNDSAVLLFGGYGDRMYSNKLVRFNLYTHRFDTIPLKGDVIDPRFYASLGRTVSGDTLYLYGGKGNPEGKQDIGVKYYYDCYLINLKDSTARRLWTQERPAQDRVQARTLLLDLSEECVYAMTYPEYMPHSNLQLYRISLLDGCETAVGDTIPMISEEIATNVALYMPEGEERIYCVVQEFEKEGATTTRIYSIAAPPVSRGELQVYAGDHDGSGGWKWVWIGLACALAIFVAMVIVRKRRRASEQADGVEESGEVRSLGSLRTLGSLGSLGSLRTEGTEGTQERGETPGSEAGSGVGPESRGDGSGIEQEKRVRVRRIERPMLPERNRISMFGPFTAIDAGGHDVTHLFSPKLRAIFIYILLGTWRKGGITASELNAVFWPDKEADKIKNLRNVTIAKLRKILGDFQGLEVVYDDGRFSVRCGEGCFVDAERLFALTDNLRNVPDDAETLAMVEALVLQGKFLQGVEAVELDACKGGVEAFALDVMLKAMERYAGMYAWEEVIRFSHLALLTDPVNEQAMRQGVMAYAAMGNRTRARSLYDGFTANYRKIYGEEYDGKYNEG